MGLIRTAKKTAISDDARRAKTDGRSVFVARFWDEAVSFQGTGAISGADDALEAVEAEGWHLEHFSYSWVPDKKRGVGVYVFRSA